MEALHSFVARLKLLSDLDLAIVDKLQDLDDRLGSLEKSHDKNKKQVQGNSTRLAEIQLMLGSKRNENK